MVYDFKWAEDIINRLKGMEAELSEFANTDKDVSARSGGGSDAPADRNNGGVTDYYALPFKPSEDFPEPTLNDLIEHKGMKFWRGEVFKATYGIEGRVEKNKEEHPLKAELREVYKILYYANRRVVVLLRLIAAGGGK